MNLKSINNYYEQRVTEKILDTLQNEDFDEEQLQDIACIALNDLPTRYVRSSAIMEFFLTDEEKNQMDIEAIEAIQKAKQYLLEQMKTDKTSAS